MVFQNPAFFEWLVKSLSGQPGWQSANLFFEKISGLKSFFSDETERSAFEKWLTGPDSSRLGNAKTEFGDFQTNLRLARETCQLLAEKGFRPGVLVEPTFGQGNFIRAAIETFPGLQKVFGVEIFKPYCWQARLSILEFFVENPAAQRPEIQLFHDDVFAFDFQSIATQVAETELLVLGNPPWVTNSALSALGSENLPMKSNFKKASGFDAMTGKGNFDLGESVTLAVLKAFHQQRGHLAFLIKTAVVRNIVAGQPRNRFEVNGLEQWEIDASKEFGAAVEAALFVARFQEKPGFECRRFDFYEKKALKTFGWSGSKMVSDLETYQNWSQFDGVCPLVWRQGMKHDCSKIMELERENGHFLNGFQQTARLENEPVFGLLKSSDLKETVVGQARKWTILTQRKIGQDTAHLEKGFPETWAYLMENRPFFEARKSSIYKNSPAFAIFGIGDYSFKPYKVAISGLYKRTLFSLVLPENGKPLMLDDTCYFLGFDRFQDASLVQALLNGQAAQAFLQTIIFRDAKRAITKEVLMRIDLAALLSETGFYELEFSQHADYQEVGEKDWSQMLQKYHSENAPQLALF